MKPSTMSEPSRRDLLRVGALSALGLSLPALFAAKSRAAEYGLESLPARAKSCIFLFLSGGPSQFETFDPKPEARVGNRNIFETVQTSVPGTLLCEHLPDLAKQAQRFA